MKLACLALLGAALLRGQASSQADLHRWPRFGETSGSGIGHGQTFSQTDLQHWLAVWQQKQQLQDWAIEIAVARQRDFDSKSTVGDSRVLGPRRARIRVLDARELRSAPGQNFRKYTELTVVHELVHLSLWDLQGGNSYAPEWDSTVEDIAEALLFGDVPACATPRDFMEAEIVSLPWKPVDARIREQVIRKLTAAFLDGRPSWPAQHRAACASVIKDFFARSGWR